LLRDYHGANYHAGTTSLFIVGDVEKEKVFENTSRLLAKMKHQREKTNRHFEFPTHRSPRVVTLGRDIHECHVQLAFQTPGVNDPRIPEIDLICSVLGQGESSRLYQRLVKETKLALDIQLGLVATCQCGLITLGFSCIPENLNDCLCESLRTIDKAISAGVEELEIQRVKNSLEAEVVAGMETVEGCARRMGYDYIQFGDTEYERKYLQQILAVEKERALATLQTFISSTEPTLSLVHPLSFVPPKEKLKGLIANRQIAPPKPLRASSSLTRRVCDSFTFITKEISSLPILTARFIWMGGSRTETSRQYGLAHLFERTWTSGTDHLSSLQIAQLLEGMGATLSPFCGRNTLGLTIECLSKHWHELKPVLQEILIHPCFPENEINTEKNLVLRDILAERDTPGQVCQLNFMHALFGDHPYGRSVLGNEETVKSFDRHDLLDFYRKSIGRERLVTVAVGDFQSDSLLDQIAELCLPLPKQSHHPDVLSPIVPPKALKIVTATKSPLFQTHLLVGFLGCDITASERYAMKLLSSALAGQGGRLFLELRDKKSLAYSVSPICTEQPGGGMFGFYIGCAPEKWKTALIGLRNEIEKILNHPLAEDELKRAKQYWLGRFELDMQRYASQALVYGLDEVYGLGFDHALRVADNIESVKSDKIRNAAARYLTLDRATISIVHPEPLGTSSIENLWKQGS